MTLEPKRIFLSPPHMNGEEIRFIHDAFASNYIAPTGPQVEAFEQEFSRKVGIGHALAVSSGTAAMHLALRVLGVDVGDEVIVSTLTFIGSVSPVVFQGGIPVFIDSDPSSWNMDPDLLEQELARCRKSGRLPKAVVPTDLYGQCANLDRILNICEPYGVPVVVDAAEALGAKYQKKVVGRQKAEGRGQTGPGSLKSAASSNWLHAGKGAKAAIFSFNGNKIITTSGGGMLVSDDPELISQARFLSQQARDPAPHYEHSQLGYNYRMSNVLAAIGRGQLRALDQRVEQKRKIFVYYEEALRETPGIQLMPEAPYSRSNRWLTVALINPEEFGSTREHVRLALEAENIESRPIWKPMHLQPVFEVENGPSVPSESENAATQIRRQTTNPKRYRARLIGGGVSEYLYNIGLCLPSGTQMMEKEQNRIVEIIRRVGKQGNWEPASQS